jgi:hypothetical protein
MGSGKWDLPVGDPTKVTTLHRGDLIFWQSDTKVSMALSQLTNHPFTHISVVWKPGTWMSATVIDCDVHNDVSGVNEWLLCKKIAEWTGDYMALMPAVPMSDEEHQQFDLIGHKCNVKVKQFHMDPIYALNAIFLKSKAIHERFKCSNKYFCSELITYMLQHIGRLDNSIPRSFLTPVDYWNRTNGLDEFFTQEPTIYSTDDILTKTTKIAITTPKSKETE